MADTPAKPRGRRPGRADTRGVICRAALALFSSVGYDKVSLRAIAREADVDPALIHHYFSSKSDLFAEVVLDLPLDAERLVADVLNGPRDRIGPAAVAAFLAAYDAPDGARERFTAMLRWAVAQGGPQRPLTEFMSKEVFGAIAERLGHSDFKLRGQLAVSLVLGMALSRYVLPVPTLANTEDRVIIESLGRAMQQLLVEEW
ncbi:TetR/AcrR family transcriptional regulator [Micropruina sp.]|uniref:TetR/AcrR family transcriptional regulator n=1 Tax=Micropruina sp. TaxID=2737536 RepID=UPI00260F6C90|nr:TetR/AcrR family transcriptional regulator [Micropruina sp.]